MIKTRIAVVATALSVMATAVSFGANPQMGTWKLNEAKSKLATGMGKNTMVVYAEQGGEIKITVEGVDKDGKPTHGVWIGKWDGKAYPSKGNMSWDAAAYKVVNDHTNDITTMKDGKVVWTGTITVAPDGKSRTVTINGTGADGKKFHSKAVYDKS
jgi:lipopolysaccharide export LptBFGC system permease protein LptF